MLKRSVPYSSASPSTSEATASKGMTQAIVCESCINREKRWSSSSNGAAPGFREATARSTRRASTPLVRTASIGSDT